MVEAMTAMFIEADLVPPRVQLAECVSFMLAL